MSMTASDRKALLSQWIKPSSESEQERQERAERMIRNAINAHPAFNETPITVYAKGSYPNNTNVRVDSDVDVVVENHDLYYFDYFPGVTPSPRVRNTPYAGTWTPENWRSEVTKALTNCFGRSDVDTSGSVALRRRREAR